MANDARIRIRVNRRTGELELEGPPQVVAEWWDKLWPEMVENAQSLTDSPLATQPQPLQAAANTQFPDVFGEFFSEFRSNLTDVDKVLIAGAFIQGKETDRAFTTKSANQLLMDQNIKVGNASECVRRLLQSRRAFVFSDGKFRVSASGFEHLKSLKVNQ